MATDLIDPSAVQTARRSRRLSRSQLADLAGVARRTICNIEAGAHKPTDETLWKITDALRIHDESAEAEGRAA